MSEFLSDMLEIIGAVFLLLAALGIVRMPDLFTRMQAATKASTLGAACTLGAAALHFGDLGVATRAMATMLFFFLTAPVTAHLIGRASYFVGTPLWKGSVVDELRANYDPLTHECEAPPELQQAAAIPPRPGMGEGARG